MNWLEWLLAERHRLEKGHLPVWYLLGAGRRQCLECLKGGHRKRIIRPLTLAARPL